MTSTGCSCRPRASRFEAVFPVEGALHDGAGAGVIGDEGLAAGLVRSASDHVGVVEAEIEPVDDGLVDVDVEIVLRDRPLFTENPDEDTQVRLGGHRCQLDRDHRLHRGVLERDGLEIAHVAVGSQLQGQKEKVALHVRHQQLDAQVTELVAVFLQPIRRWRRHPRKR